MFLRDRTITRGDILRYLESEDFLAAFVVWKRWMRFGFYNPGGPSGQPGEIVKIIDLFEDEKAFVESERLAEVRNRHGNTH